MANVKVHVNLMCYETEHIFTSICNYSYKNFAVKKCFDDKMKTRQ